MDDQKKNLIMISQQAADPENIFVDTNSYGPVFGQTRENSPAMLSDIARHIGAELSGPEKDFLLEQIRFQLPFLRVITDTQQFVHISIGSKISQIQMKKLSSWIDNRMQEYNVVFLTNIDLPSSTKSRKSDEEKDIAKIIKTASLSTPLLAIFHKILDLQKKKPEIVAYVNPGDFGKPVSLTTRYICAVG